MVQSTASELLYDRALKVMPGGCSRNTVLHTPHPFYASHAKGCTITDIEGIERIDFANNMASLIHGHAYPEVVEAVSQQLVKGTAFTFATEVEVEYAEYLVSRSTSFEKLRFVNSGTEAVMACLKAGRAFTGKAKIAKAEGAYHGLYDYAEVSQTARPENWGDASNPSSVPVSHGTPNSTLDDVIIFPFNDIEKTISILERNKDELSAILIDLMPHRVALHPVQKDYVEALFQWTRKNGILFICDEVITFRSEYGGAQSWYNIKPDLTAIGKMIGGGFPVGAIAGRADIMDVMNPLKSNLLFPHSGTFSANPVTMTAGLMAMKLFDEKAVARLNKLGHYAREKLTEVIKIADLEACITGGGSMFRIHLRPTAPNNYREAYADEEQQSNTKFLLNYLFGNGISLINTCSGTLSTVMSEKEIDVLADTVLGGMRVLKQMV